MKRLPSGTELELEEGLITRIWEPGKHLWLEAVGKSGQLVEARFRLPDGEIGILRTGQGVDPVLGDVDGFFLPEVDEPLALVGSISWARPTHIPAIDKPASLPGGLGAAVLNYLSLQAFVHGLGPLRYKGPYATGKLFDSLHRSFHLGDQDPIQAWKQFNHAVEDTSLQGISSSPAIDFFPSPFEWIVQTPAVCAEVRGSLQRLMIEGRVYEEDLNVSRQLISLDDGYRAAIVLGGKTWAERFEVDGKGCPRGPLQSLPALESPLIGRLVEAPLRKVLADALVRRAPLILQESLQIVLMKLPLSWGDTGDEACLFKDGHLVLHAGIAVGLATQTPDQVLTTLAYAVEPVATRVARQVLETYHGRDDNLGEERA